MKYAVITLGAFLLCANVSFAQEARMLPLKRDEIRLHIEQKRADIQPKIEQKRVEIKSQIDAEKPESKDVISVLVRDRFSQILNQVFERFDAVVVKFDGLTARIDARIAKLDEAGVSTVESKELLVAAKAQIEESAALVSASKLESQAALAGDVTKDELQAIVNACKTSLKDSHASLVAVVASLKKADPAGEDIIIE